MFGNLIESGLHTRDFRRKGSFFLGTFVFYSALLAAAGVGSIYAYNTHLEDQQYEVVSIMRFSRSPSRIEPKITDALKPAGSNSIQRLTSRIEASVITPYKGDKIASVTTKEIKAGTPFTISNVEFNTQPDGGMIGPSGSFGGREGGSFSGGGMVKLPEEIGPPPIPKVSPTPQPTPKQKILTVSKILNGSAISKPAPPYPHLAKITRVSGVVAVQILIDEQGRVVSAQPTSGHPMLRQAAMQAAYQARFSPTYLGEHPVKVSGVITYNFVLQ